MSNNIAEDKNNVDIVLVLVKKEEDEGTKNITLLKGNYSITINNTNLSKINMNVYENGKLRKDLSAKYELKKLQIINFNRNIVSPELDIKFIPYGDRGSTANIRIRLL